MCCDGGGQGRAPHGAQQTKVRERRVENENLRMLRISMAPPQFAWASSALQDLAGLGFPSRALGCHLRCPEFQRASGQFSREERISSCYWHLVDPKASFFFFFFNPLSAWSVALGNCLLLVKDELFW